MFFNIKKFVISFIFNNIILGIKRVKNCSKAA